jgi:hypothetical protein
MAMSSEAPSEMRNGNGAEPVRGGESADPRDPAALAAWRAFLGGPSEAALLTPERRARLAALEWPRPPAVADYDVVALAFRLNEEREEMERAHVDRLQRDREELAMRDRLREEQRARVEAEYAARVAEETRELAERMERVAGAETEQMRTAARWLAREAAERLGGWKRARNAALEILRQAVHYVPSARERADLYGVIGLAGDYLETFEHRPSPDLAERAADSLEVFDDVLDGFEGSRVVPVELRQAIAGAVHGCDWSLFMRWLMAAAEQLPYAPELDELAVSCIEKRAEWFRKPVGDVAA